MPDPWNYDRTAGDDHDDDPSLRGALEQIARFTSPSQLGSNYFVHSIASAALDRLSAVPVDDRERVPEGWRVEWRQFAEVVGAADGGVRYHDIPHLVPVSHSVDPEEKP